MEDGKGAVINNNGDKIPPIDGKAAPGNILMRSGKENKAGKMNGMFKKGAGQAVVKNGDRIIENGKQAEVAGQKKKMKKFKKSLSKVCKMSTTCYANG